MTDIVEAAFIGALVGGAIAILGSLVTSLVNNHHAENRRKSEQQKWYAEHFLGRKIDALSNLYSALIDATTAIKWHSAGHISTYQQFLAEVSEVVDRYEMKLARAFVYLSEDDRNVLTILRSKFRQSSLAIWFAVSNKQIEIAEESYNGEYKQIPWEELREADHKAMAVMEKLLSPDVLKGIEPEE